MVFYFYSILITTFISIFVFIIFLKFNIKSIKSQKGRSKGAEAFKKNWEEAHSKFRENVKKIVPQEVDISGGEEEEEGEEGGVVDID